LGKDGPFAGFRVHKGKAFYGWWQGTSKDMTENGGGGGYGAVQDPLSCIKTSVQHLLVHRCSAHVMQSDPRELHTKVCVCCT
jgi:hypothetical protein